MVTICIQQHGDEFYYTTEDDRIVGPFESKTLLLLFLKRYVSCAQISTTLDSLPLHEPKVYEREGMWYWSDGYERGPYLDKDAACREIETGYYGI